MTPSSIVQHRLKKLRRLDKEARTSGSHDKRRDLYVRLYRTARVWDRHPDRRKFMKALGIENRSTSGLSEIIIALVHEATRIDGKLKSRHGSALRYAALKRVAPKNLSAFLDDCGGYSGAARRYAKWRKKDRVSK